MERGMVMFTISSILQDINRHCAIYNMLEDKFTYRLVYFINAQNGNEKHCIEARFDGLKAALEGIVRGNLTTKNNVVIAAITARKDGEIVSLLSRSYPFSLNEYFQWITGKRKNRNNTYNNRYAQAIY